MGPTGAGKTSLLALLLRFAEPTSGQIDVGGSDLAAIAVRPWRAQIAWVPQHPHLFAGTVADNIALGRPGASRPAVARAAGLAGATGLIDALPAGYDTQLGERALRLSAPRCRPPRSSSARHAAAPAASARYSMPRFRSATRRRRYRFRPGR